MKQRMITIVCLLGLMLVNINNVFADINFKDVMGRDIHLEKPAQRIFLGFYFEDYLAITGPDAYQKVVIYPRKSWQDFRRSQWNTYTKVMPELKDITDSGSIYTGTFDFEKLLSIKPEVALVAAWQFKALGSKVAILESAGIKVVVIDFNAQTLAKHLLSAAVIGKVMGTEKRAQAIVLQYQEAVKDVQLRIAGYLKSNPSRRVYLEVGTSGPSEYGKSYANAMWGNILNMAGADNIANEKFTGNAHLTPEYVISKDPEIIFITGAHWAKYSDSALLGFDISKAQALERYRPYLNRPGWQHLSAVKNGNVHGIYHSGARTIYDYVFLQYLAKSIYPEAFQDIDPQQSHRDFFDKFMPVQLKGTFMLQVQG